MALLSRCTWIAVIANLEVSVGKRKWLGKHKWRLWFANKFSPVNPCIPVLPVVKIFQEF